MQVLQVKWYHLPFLHFIIYEVRNYTSTLDVISAQLNSDLYDYYSGISVNKNKEFSLFLTIVLT